MRRRGLLSPVEEPPRTSLAAGLSMGCVIAVVMLLATTFAGIAAFGMSKGLAICLSCIVAGVAGGLLQQVCFNPRVLGLPWGYPARVALFGIAYLAALVPCAWLGGWLPVDVPGAWISFVVIYLVILGACTFGLSRRYRRQRAAYAECLDAYRARRAHEGGAGPRD